MTFSCFFLSSVLHTLLADIASSLTFTEPIDQFSTKFWTHTNNVNCDLIRRFSVKYRWVFLRASCTVFLFAREASQNANKEWRFLAILHTKTFKKLFIIQLLYFKRISCKTGKVKQKEKRSTRSRPDEQIFLQDKTINLPISRDIFVQFARYLYPAKCSWLKNISYKTSWCVVSLRIFTSCAVFWLARRASPKYKGVKMLGDITHQNV